MSTIHALNHVTMDDASPLQPGEQGYVVCVKGAAGGLLERSTHILHRKGPLPIEEHDVQQIHEAGRQHGQSGAARAGRGLSQTRSAARENDGRRDRARSDLRRPDRHDRSGAARSETRHRQGAAGGHPHGHDHGRSSRHRARHRRPDRPAAFRRAGSHRRRAGADERRRSDQGGGVHRRLCARQPGPQGPHRGSLQGAR